MLTLGVLGLTSYCQSKLKKDYEQAWKDAKRKQCCISATCERVTREDAHDAAVGQPQVCSPEKKDLSQVSMELLNGPPEQLSAILQYELVRLTWTNRAALKGRIVVLNVESRYLDSLLKRAAGEDVGGFVFCSEGEQPLQTDQLEVFLRRIEDAFKGLPLASIPPVWHAFGTDFCSLVTSDSIVRIIDVHEFSPTKENLFLLPGSGEGHYSSAWVPDAVSQSLCKNGTMSTLDSLQGFWTWMTTEINIDDYDSKQDVAARMRNLDLYNETRYFC